MTSGLLFIIIITIIVVNQLFDYLLDYLNISYRNKEIPSELSDVYDEKQYRNQQAYKIETSRFSFWSSFVSFMGILLILFFDGFAFLDDYIRQIISNEILISIVFFGVLMFLSSLISLPL